MKYIDTNILIRLITNDVPELTRQAIAMLENSKLGEIMLLDAVITEACFVLEFNPSYQLSRPVIYDGLYAILDEGKLCTDKHTHDALDLYVAHPRLDYVDCLLLVGAGGKQANLLTFDKTVLKKAS